MVANKKQLKLYKCNKEMHECNQTSDKCINTIA